VRLLVGCYSVRPKFMVKGEHDETTLSILSVSTKIVLGLALFGIAAGEYGKSR